MNNTLACLICLTILFTAIPTKAIAGLGTTRVEKREIPTASLAGVWQDKQYGATMIIREQDGFLDISGKDPVSMYSFTCLIDVNSDSKYSCYGEGMNHRDDFRFLYKTTLELTKAGLLEEAWQVSSINKDKNGTAVFERITEREI